MDGMSTVLKVLMSKRWGVTAGEHVPPPEAVGGLYHKDKAGTLIGIASRPSRRLYTPSGYPNRAE
jgi:hypothetical protein